VVFLFLFTRLLIEEVLDQNNDNHRFQVMNDIPKDYQLFLLLVISKIIQIIYRQSDRIYLHIVLQQDF